ncbi:hypothetical protein [Nostoc sp.]|uniref:hypothetical protein n=1 Tax=Nostoc sp. TaxID=1180 RepID=UPI002FF5BEF4
MNLSVWGDEGVGSREWEVGEMKEMMGQGDKKSVFQCPMPNAQCPMPNAQCPMPNAQCPMPNDQCPMTNDQ